MKTDNINIRINHEVKQQAEEIFSSLGLSVSDAVNVFLHKSIMEKGLPFDVKQNKYNAETMEALKEAKELAKKGAGFSSVNDFLSDLKEYAENN